MKGEGFMRRTGLGRVLVILLLSIAVVSTSIAFKKSPVRLVCDIWPPYQVRTGDGISGFSTELVQAVLQRMGAPVESLESFPWKRALDILENGGADALFSANLTHDRTIFARYPEEKLFDAPWIIWTRTGRAVHSLEDLKGMSVGVVIGYSYTKSFWDFVQTYCRVEKVTTDEINMKKLALNRLDAVAAEYGNGLYLIRRLGLRGITPHPDIVIKKDGLYIMFNRRNVRGSFVKQFSKELKAFKASPEYDGLRVKYFGE